MWIYMYRCVFMFVHVHMSVYAGVCLFMHRYVGMCAFVCTHMHGCVCSHIGQSIAGSWAGLTWGEVSGVHRVVPVGRGPVIPQHELCVTELCSGLDSWRRGYLEQSLLCGFVCIRTVRKADGAWGRNASVLSFSSPSVPASVSWTSEKLNDTGIVFTESPGTRAGWLKKIGSWAGGK